MNSLRRSAAIVPMLAITVAVTSSVVTGGDGNALAAPIAVLTLAAAVALVEARRVRRVP